MKKKIKITDFFGKTKEIIIGVRNRDFYLAQQQYHPSTVHKSKKDYTRKQKHKKNYLDDDNSFLLFINLKQLEQFII